MRKHVTPAEPGAVIPDPSRGRDLPAEGAAVDWNVYWAGRLARGEIQVSEIADEDEPDPEPPGNSVAKRGSAKSTSGA